MTCALPNRSARLCRRSLSAARERQYCESKICIAGTAMAMTTKPTPPQHRPTAAHTSDARLKVAAAQTNHISDTFGTGRQNSNGRTMRELHSCSRIGIRGVVSASIAQCSVLASSSTTEVSYRVRNGEAFHENGLASTRYPNSARPPNIGALQNIVACETAYSRRGVASVGACLARVGRDCLHLGARPEGKCAY